MTRSDAVALFDEHAAGLHRYLARRVGEEAAADVLVATLTSPAAMDDRPRLFGIANDIAHRLTELHDPDDPLSVRLAAVPARQRDALLLAAWGRLDPDEIAVALAVAPDAAAALLRGVRETLPDADGLAVLRSDIRSDAATLADLRERVAAHDRPADPAAPDDTVPPPPGPSGIPRIRWRAVAGAGALLAVLAVALLAIQDREPVAPQATSTDELPAAPPSTDALGQAAALSAYSEWSVDPGTGWMAGPVTELSRLPRATDPPAGAVADLDLTMRDPTVGPGKYLYRRVDQGGFVTDLWIPADVGAEWLMRQSGPGVDRIEERRTYGDFTTLFGFNTISVSDLAPDPRRNHTLLRVAGTISPHPPSTALRIVADTLMFQPVPAGLRDDLLAALGYVPDLQVSTEDDGRTAVISVDRTAAGEGRTDLLVDVATGMVLGDRFTFGGETFTTTVTTAVADEIGVAPS